MDQPNNKKVALLIETSCKPKNPVRPDKITSVFDRVFRRLFDEGRSPGKINTFLLEDEGSYRVIGVLTENIGGSLSFFPDFIDKINKKYYFTTGIDKVEKTQTLDHFTLNRDFSKKGHITKVDEKGIHRKDSKYDLAPTINGQYCWLTICLNNSLNLNDFSGFIKATFSSAHTNVKNIWEKGIGKNVLPVSLPNKPIPGRFGCIQILLIKKGWKDNLKIPRIEFFKGALGTGLFGNIEIPKEVFSHNWIIETSNGFGFDIVLLAFNLEGDPVVDIGILVKSF